VAACLLADPELLILDEPMNGLDPAGMHEMRAMIASLAGEGRTVVLSSHLLDEVQRTCNAVAIVDHGRVIRQGSIDELIRGAGAAVVQVDCAEPARAAQLIDQAGIAAGTALTDTALADTGLAVTLPAGASREVVADLNRRLVGAGIDVYGLRQVQASPASTASTPRSISTRPGCGPGSCAIRSSPPTGSRSPSARPPPRRRSARRSTGASPASTPTTPRARSPVPSRPITR
jgi:ABC-type multidrug transport system ATPase subunit